MLVNLCKTMSMNRIVLFMFLPFAVFVFYSCSKKINTDKYDVETIAYVDTIQYQHGMNILFKYYVNSIDYDIRIKFKGDLLLPKHYPLPVRYSSKKPSKSKILFDYPIPINDSVEINYISKTGYSDYKLKKIK